jgi:formylmethanofuran dehydrogenase subunit E
MARKGLELLGIDDPEKFRDLIVYVECDRCLTDAIGTVTGCTLGRRRLKWLDYGKSAATFLNSATGKAIRLFSIKKVSPPEGADLIGFFNSIPDEEIFGWSDVKVNYRDTDLPGKPREATVCSRCGERVSDGRHVVKEGSKMCKACAESTYYTLL